MIDDPGGRMTNDEIAEVILIAHQRHRGGCLCGWSELGASLPRHQVAMLREAGLISDGPLTPGYRLPTLT